MEWVKSVFSSFAPAPAQQPRRVRMRPAQARAMRNAAANEAG